MGYKWYLLEWRVPWISSEQKPWKWLHTAHSSLSLVSTSPGLNISPYALDPSYLPRVSVTTQVAPIITSIIICKMCEESFTSKKKTKKQKKKTRSIHSLLLSLTLSSDAVFFHNCNCQQKALASLHWCGYDEPTPHVHIVKVASFPGRSHLHTLQQCSHGPKTGVVDAWDVESVQPNLRLLRCSWFHNYKHSVIITPWTHAQLR